MTSAENLAVSNFIHDTRTAEVCVLFNFLWAQQNAAGSVCSAEHRLPGAVRRED